MTSDLSTIHLEGARIVRVIEDADRQSLTVEVSHPIAEGGSDFPRRRLTFQWFSRYIVEEGRLAGEPTIQRVEIMDADHHRGTIRMHTDHGVREVTCLRTVLEESL